MPLIRVFGLACDCWLENVAVDSDCGCGGCEQRSWPIQYVRTSIAIFNEERRERICFCEVANQEFPKWEE